ncbi:MAG: ABC transporter permease subunit [Microthrixaceae bacterium]
MSDVPETGPPGSGQPESGQPDSGPDQLGLVLTSGSGRRMRGREMYLGLLFLVPALVLLGAIVVYPVFFTLGRSFFSARGGSFVGIDNYQKMFASASTRTAIKNNVIWVVVAPVLATSIGLVFAVLTERIKLGTAFKLLIFMPMAISFLAAGVIFRLVYDQSPDRGVLNAAGRAVVGVFQEPGPYPRARPVDEAFTKKSGGFTSTDTVQPGSTMLVGMVGVPPAEVPDDAKQAEPALKASDGTITGVVWLDFARGGGGTRGQIDRGELGLPNMTVQLVDSAGKVLASATTDTRGRFRIDDVSASMSLSPRLASSNFRAPWPGEKWLGPSLVTPAVIGSFLWIWTGFAMMLIAAGLSAIPRETMEAARVDGASEWQVFRRVTVPLLRPVLLVVVVTLVINVLKIFDLVLVIPPSSSQASANVIALELWRVSFGGGSDQGLGSALGVLLFVLVLPAMLFNIKRFRSEET